MSPQRYCSSAEGRSRRADFGEPAEARRTIFAYHFLRTDSHVERDVLLSVFQRRLRPQHAVLAVRPKRRRRVRIRRLLRIHELAGDLARLAHGQRHGPLRGGGLSLAAVERPPERLPRRPRRQRGHVQPHAVRPRLLRVGLERHRHLRRVDLLRRRHAAHLAALVREARRQPRHLRDGHRALARDGQLRRIAHAHGEVGRPAPRERRLRERALLLEGRRQRQAFRCHLVRVARRERDAVGGRHAFRVHHHPPPAGERIALLRRRLQRHLRAGLVAARALHRAAGRVVDREPHLRVRLERREVGRVVGGGHPVGGGFRKTPFTVAQA